MNLNVSIVMYMSGTNIVKNRYTADKRRKKLAKIEMAF